MDLLLSYIIRIIVFMSRFTKFLAKLKIGKYEEMSEDQPIKILLVGYNGARNTGADARVVGIVQQLKKLYEPDQIQITVMTLNKESLKGYFDLDVELLEFSSIFLFPLYKACSTHHVAILCEGSTLKSKFADALTLFFIEAAGIMKNQHKPCIAYGSEIGDMNPYLKRLSTALCKDTYFITRTKPSYEALKSLHLQGHIGTDTAMDYHDEISKDEVMTLLKQSNYDGKKKILGIAVIDPFCWPVKASLTKWIKGKLTGNMQNQYDKWYFFTSSKAAKRNYQNYIRQIASTISKYQDEYFVVIIGMEKLDQKACNDLRNLLPQQTAMFLSKDYTASYLVGILRNLDLLVTSRYHAAILSMDHAIPVIAISMDERLDGIMKELGFASKYLCHVEEKNLSLKLDSMIQEAKSNEVAICHHIKTCYTKYQSIFIDMGQFLKHYIQKGVHYD